MAQTFGALHKLPKECPTCGAFLTLGNGLMAVGWGIPDWRAEPGVSPVFYAPDFLLDAKLPFLQFPEWAVLPSPILRELWSSTAREGSVGAAVDAVVDAPLDRRAKNVAAWRWREPHRGLFAQTFAEIQGHLKTGFLQKAVPVVFAECAQPTWPGWIQQVVGDLLAVGADSSIYGYWTAERGLLGATPELLFHQDIRNYQLQTMALAGTRTQGQGSDEEFLVDDKEMAEHGWVVRGLHERLADLGQLVCESTRVIQVGRLRHLMTPMRVENLADLDFLDLVRRLHPTPALGAYPLAAAQVWLRQQPRRGHFGAPFAFLYPGEYAHCVVAIRNIQWADGLVRLGSGCGIVQGSDLDREWQELAQKRQAVRENMHLKTMA